MIETMQPRDAAPTVIMATKPYYWRRPPFGDWLRPFKTRPIFSRPTEQTFAAAPLFAVTPLTQQEFKDAC